LKEAVNELLEEVEVPYYGQRSGPRWQISDSSASQYQLQTDTYECQGNHKVTP